MNLAQTQEFFWNAIADTKPVARTTIDALFVGTPELSALDRLEIYAGMYINRLIDALGAEYPRVRAELGDEHFFTTAEAYLRESPSRHPSIDQVGQHFPKYLRKHSSKTLAALASRERAESVVFDAADATPINSDALAHLPPNELPSVVLTPIPALACIGTTLLFRRDEIVRHRTMPRLEARAMKLMLKRRPLSDICEVFASEPHPVQAAFAVIGSWIASGWIASIAIDD